MPSLSTDVAAGAMAGGVARMVVAPFDLVKIRFQIQVGAPASPFPTLRNGIPALPQRTAAPPSIDSLQYRGILQTVRHIVRNEGVLAFWKGTWAAQILSMIYSSVQFTTYHSIHPAILKAFESPPWFDPLSAGAAAPFSNATSHSLASLIAGAGSGCVATVASYPFDLLRTRLAAQQDSKVYASMRAGLAAIVRAHGVRGLFVGLWPTLVGIVPYAALTFGSYERARDTLMMFEFSTQPDAVNSPLLPASNDVSSASPRKLTATATMACGVMSGLVSKLLTYPLDVIKKRFQIAGFQYSAAMPAVATSTLAPPAGVWSCARSIVAREGWAALYKGVVPSMLKAAPNAGVTFVAFETFRAALDGSSRTK